nr:hypothetical protein [Mycobacterium uberis]
MNTTSALTAAGNVRPGWRELAEVIGEHGRACLSLLCATVSALVGNDDIIMLLSIAATCPVGTPACLYPGA